MEQPKQLVLAIETNETILNEPRTLTPEASGFVVRNSYDGHESHVNRPHGRESDNSLHVNRPYPGTLIRAAENRFFNTVG